MALPGTLHEEEALGKAYDARLMRRLLRYLRPYRWQVLLAILVLTLASAAQIVGPWITQLVIDVAIPERDTGYLGTLVALFLVATVIAFFLEYAQDILTTWIGTVGHGRPAIRDLRKAAASGSRCATTTGTRSGG
jgi:ATP-binding cassette, subfamily B, multidrug efflux pump